MAEKEKRDEQTHIIFNTRNCIEFLLLNTYEKSPTKLNYYEWLAENNLITKEELERLNKIK